MGGWVGGVFRSDRAGGRVARYRDGVLREHGMGEGGVEVGERECGEGHRAAESFVFRDLRIADEDGDKDGEPNVDT